MKYGVNTMVWTTRMNREQEGLLSRIKEWGFDGVELFLSLNEPANIPEMRQILDRLGLDRTTCAVLPRDANLVEHGSRRSSPRCCLRLGDVWSAPVSLGGK